jgi:hypothetical protein
LRYYGDLKKDSNLEQLIANVREAIAVAKVTPPSVEEIKGALTARTFPGVFGAVLHVYARSQGKRRAGDKTPDHHLYLDEIPGDFPQSPIVFVMRDPRDTVLSLQKAFGATVEAAAHTWNEAFASYAKVRGAVHLLRYEELARAPQQTIEALCGAIDERYEPDMLRFFEHVPGRLHREEKHKKLTRPIDASSVGTFRQMPAVEIQTIESICAEGMEALDYAFTSAPKFRSAVSRRPPAILRRVRDRLRYYGFHAGRWRAGLVRWKMMLRVRLRYWLTLGLLRIQG